MLYAGPPDAQIEETHLAHVPDPRQNLPGQEGSREPSPFALLTWANNQIMSKSR